YEPGWRLRAVGALGRYDYRGTLFGAGSDLGTTFDGDASYGAALLGYQVRARTLIVKLFAGVEAEDQRISPRDPANSVQGTAVGLKLAAESWVDLSPQWFLSVDGSYGLRFSNIGAWRGRAIALGPCCRSVSKAARSAMSNAGRGGG